MSGAEIAAAYPAPRGGGGRTPQAVGGAVGASLPRHAEPFHRWIQAAAAPSTMLRMVPFPRLASLCGGGCKAPGRFLVDLVGYGLVSVVALACDYGLLVSLARLGMDYLLAATISFSLGMLVAYTLSARFVFANRRARSTRAKLLGFFAVGLAGLLLTQGLLALLVSGLGVAVALAKIPTAGCVFLFNFLARRGLVFAGATSR